MLKIKNRQRLSMIAAALLMISGCGGGKSGDRSLNLNGEPRLQDLQPYQASSPFAQSAMDCAVIYQQGQSCQIRDIAPLGYQKSGDLTPDDIAQRLLVSHSWMGDSFMDVVRGLPQEMLNLFKPLNVIVLSFEVRPSFYHSATASIYIDPRYLWRDVVEWSDIYQQDDYRSGFASRQRFIALQRYVDPASGNYVTYSNTFNEFTNYWRSEAEIRPGLFRLLAHELAHANDFLPPDLLDRLDASTSIQTNIDRNKSSQINQQLYQDHALKSGDLAQAAKSYFGGSSVKKVLAPEQAGATFEPDGAADFYGYYTAEEDVAMLFEAYMMWREYGVVSDVGFTTVPTTVDYSCDDLILGWGQRNRLAQKEVAPRAKLVSESILQQNLTAEFVPINNATPVDLPYGAGWCQSRTAVMSARFERLFGPAPVMESNRRYREEMSRD
ncbi:hypothetical protein [Photobacterium galatheae]|uniref:Lipoprotein n=1 Tax=Photobacterium galatheae TaxID=1654360 RepID=A0A066RYE6_9GAMM|nr:hypothetical protein [Photobacterium galatheae]KDM92662.1 hypothetical protein EA58_04610 [Photobacterium galatheae]MCM0149419.1 hypothetical protein [Photobacterium galatheae]